MFRHPPQHRRVKRISRHTARAPRNSPDTGGWKEIPFGIKASTDVDAALDVCDDRVGMGMANVMPLSPSPTGTRYRPDTCCSPGGTETAGRNTNPK